MNQLDYQGSIILSVSLLIRSFKTQCFCLSINFTKYMYHILVCRNKHCVT